MSNRMSTGSLLKRFARTPGRHGSGRMLRFWLRAKLHPELHRHWFELLDRPALVPATRATRGLCSRLQQPYVSARLTLLQRFNLVRKHFELVARMPVGARTAIYSPSGLLVVKFHADGVGHEVRLVHRFGTEREGDLSLVWDCDLGQVAMATFALANSRLGFRAMVVGGLQGANGDEAHALYQRLTRDMHGLRPMSALVQFLQLAAQALGVEKILCVEDAAHAVYRPGSRIARKKTLSYDAVWREHGGVPWGHGLHEIPLRAMPRDLAEVASKKRSMYRKRYALLEEVAVAAQASLEWSRAWPQPRVEAPWTPRPEATAPHRIPGFADAFA